MKSQDALVLGAGAAGLAAARELSRAGWTVTVLEARARVGGRIHTLWDPTWPVPLELGAEFVHGEAADVRAAADAAGLPVEELPDVHVASRRGRWRPMRDFHGEIESALGPAAGRGRDLTLAEYLRARRMPRTRAELLRLYVEGYLAAQPERVSVRWLAADAGGAHEPSARRQHRVVAGYGALVRWLSGGFDRERVHVRLNSVATHVEWRRGAVAVRCRTVTGHRLAPFRARALIVTVPLGVLKAPAGEPGAIEFSPPLTAKADAFAGLEVGQVCKLILRFRSRFWEEAAFLERRLPRRRPAPEDAPINFWHDGRLAFPTWWTAAPRHAPVLTAWAGGPAAEALLGRRPGALIGAALDALAGVMRRSRPWLEAQLEAWAWHDWRADPFGRGAYSYVAAGGESAAAALARPVAGTLFFAGEATDPNESGTVQAALASGRRAARQLRRAAGAAR
jgi:monoamine oxidase